MAKLKFTARSQNVYSEFTPPKELNTIIEKFWEFTCKPGKGETITFHLIPDYTSSLLYISSDKSNTGRLAFSGPNTLNIPFNTAKNITVVGARFKPLKLQKVFQLSAAVSVNKLTDFKGIFPDQHREFKKKLSSTGNVIDQFCKLVGQNILTAGDDDKGEINKAIDLIVSSGGNIKLNTLYETISISPRHFQRKFHDAAGLSPKEFCKILRFHSVTRQLIKNNFDHFDVLVKAGYYDQSHYYKEFKNITGRLPKDFEARQKSISKNLVS